jgi:hypothetical protein
MSGFIDPRQITWATNLFDSLMNGGTWAVPRSALIYQRADDALVLVGRMAHHKDLPYTESDWKAEQQHDIDGTRAVFEAAGITVREKLKD